MARSRAWIAVLGALLVGIVALNVFGLSLSSSISQTAAEADEIERANSLLREQITRVNSRRGARAAERAALAVTGSPVELPADPALASAGVEPAGVEPVTAPAAEVAPVEPEAAPVAVEPAAGGVGAGHGTGGCAAAAGVGVP